MRIDGKLIAEEILATLAANVTRLKTNGIYPTMAVILVGDDPASLAYIRQKQKAAERIGASLVFSHQSSAISKEQFSRLVKQYNDDPNIHGLIIQRPIPKEVGDVSDILASVALEKDVDGFLPDSPFNVPVALAVGEILRNVKSQIEKIKSTDLNNEKLFEWLKTQKIVIIGRGETAGAPIARYLDKLHCPTSIIHSQTPNPREIMRQGNIIISCVGKERVVTGDAIKPGAILMSVGIWRDNNGKLRGDYEEEEIQEIASYYTPTPGGVGPVNVACLMQNLVAAASR